MEKDDQKKNAKEKHVGQDRGKGERREKKRSSTRGKKPLLRSNPKVKKLTEVASAKTQEKDQKQKRTRR